jgi:hypothetical protein
VLHVPKISINIIYVYQMKNYGTGKRFIFTPDATDEVNHQSRLFTFFEFSEPDFALLLTHDDERSRIWCERFGYLNFRYMKQLNKKRMVDVLPDIRFSKGICERCVLGKHPQEKFDKGKTQKDSFPLDLTHSGLMGPFLHPSISKSRYVLIFVDHFSCFTWILFLRKKS